MRIKLDFPLGLLLMNCLLQPALAETIKVDDVRSLQAALDQARVNKRITRIELAAGRYALRAPIVVDERLSGTAAALVAALQARRFQAYVDLIVVRDQKRKAVKLQVQ